MTDDDFSDWEPSWSWLKRARDPALRFTPELRRARRVAFPGHPLVSAAEIEAWASADAAAKEAEIKEAAAKEAAIDAYIAAIRKMKS